MHTTLLPYHLEPTPTKEGGISVYHDTMSCTIPITSRIFYRVVKDARKLEISMLLHGGGSGIFRVAQSRELVWVRNGSCLVECKETWAA